MYLVAVRKRDCLDAIGENYMAYTETVDERYGGSFTQSSAGARDAPSGIPSTYRLAEGISKPAYGALPFTFAPDVDTHDLGIL